MKRRKPRSPAQRAAIPDLSVLLLLRELERDKVDDALRDLARLDRQLLKARQRQRAIARRVRELRRRIEFTTHATQALVSASIAIAEQAARQAVTS